MEVWKFEGLHIVCDDDKFGSLEVYMLCVMMIGLEVWKFGSLNVHMVCVMMIGLKVWRLGSLHVVVCDDKCGSSEVWKFRCCV